MERRRVLAVVAVVAVLVYLVHVRGMGKPASHYYTTRMTAAPGHMHVQVLDRGKQMTLGDFIDALKSQWKVGMVGPK